MNESRFVKCIGVSLGFEPRHVRQTLRSLRESGMTPGIRQGDLRPSNLGDVVLGLTSPTFASTYHHVRALRRLSLRSAAALPSTVHELLLAMVRTLPSSPVLGDLDLDDGFISIATDRVEIECLSLTGKRAVVRYGAPEAQPANSPIFRISLNGLRSLVEAVGANS